jgi:hypothetical protein
MVLANFDWIWGAEMVGFVVDFLTKPGRALSASAHQGKTRAVYGRIDVLGPESPDLCDPPLGAVFVLGRRELGALAESADQFLERFGLRFSLARLVTGAQDCHGGAVEVKPDIALKGSGEGDEEEAILSRRRMAALI